MFIVDVLLTAGGFACHAFSGRDGVMTFGAIRSDLQLAAVIALLSSSALRGLSRDKTEALCSHLSAVVAEGVLDPLLKQMLKVVLIDWRAVMACSGDERSDHRALPYFSPLLH